MITVTTTLAEKYFSSNIPDIDFVITGESALVTVSGNDTVILSTTLYPVNGTISLRDMSGLIDDYAYQALVMNTVINIREYEGSTMTDEKTLTTQVIFSRADISEDAATFISGHFLSLLLGSRITALGRMEYLHFIGTDAASTTAYYSDGSSIVFSMGNHTTTRANNYKMLDVSPNNFLSTGKTLTHYVVSAGNRKQRFNIDFRCPDVAPILLFENSLGVQEILYCTGEHEVKPEYSRSSAYIDGKMRNYKIEEVKKFDADTGSLNTAMGDWADELFRSPEIYICNIFGGTFNVGKEVVILDSKSERTNDIDAVPRFTFTYRYAQRNNNVVQLQREGRIFDNTFDNTFN